jgi:hypothetical protein
MNRACLLRGRALIVVASLACGPLQAEMFEGYGLEGTFTNRLAQGASWRTDRPDDRLIGKLNVAGQQDLCPDGCLSLTGDPAPNQRLVDARGSYLGHNRDNGNLNYDRGDLVAATTSLSTDLSASWRDVKVKLAVTTFIDPRNYAFNDRHSNTHFQPGITDRSAEVSRELGLDWVLRDALVATSVQIGGRDIGISAGYQHIRWGESNYLALNSLNELSPPDARLLHLPGTPINEVFQPIPAVLLNAPLGDGLSIDLVYQLGWRPVVIDPDGSYFGSVDIARGRYAVIGLGQFAEDPDHRQRLPSPGNAISDTSLTSDVLPRAFGEPGNNGQFGVKLSGYLENLNGGTELNLYALNYHSRLPYISVITTEESCMRRSASVVMAFFDCNGFRLSPNGGEPLPIDSLKTFLDYPSNIQLLGLSFNTNIGKWSLAGEYSLRPNMPLQVAVNDVVFAGLQPAFPEQDIVIGVEALGQILAGGVGSPGLISGLDPRRLAQLLVGLAADPTATTTIPGSRNALPDFLQAYRGFTTQPGQIIHGYQRFAVDQLDVTAIRALGESDNPFGADQVILLVEAGFTHIWNLPGRDRLQIEGGDFNDSHASPGADGTGSGGTPDTRRFNPTQQTSGFATSFSGGYRLLARLEYANALFGMTLKPMLFFGHDVVGISPVPIQNFIAGTVHWTVGTEVESGSAWSGQILWQGWTGGGSVNGLRDRDLVVLGIAYAF